MLDIQKEIRYSGQIKAFKKILFKKILDTFEKTDQVHRILVLGCGDGIEAGYMHHLLGARVYGVDIDKKFDPWAANYAHLQNYDGRRLPFTDGYFDAIYSYHVLEHVQDLPKYWSTCRTCPICWRKFVASFGPGDSSTSACRTNPGYWAISA